MEKLLAKNAIIIDRPQGSAHPRYPNLIYPLDYGYVEDTTAADGEGIDVWVGSLPKRSLTGILCSYDSLKRDAEIKLLLGCTEIDVKTIRNLQGRFMHYLYIPHP